MQAIRGLEMERDLDPTDVPLAVKSDDLFMESSADKKHLFLGREMATCQGGVHGLTCTEGDRSQ